MRSARRDLLLALAGMAVSPAALAQRVDRKKRVGLVFESSPASNPVVGEWLADFRQRLLEHGWTEGGNLELMVRGSISNKEKIAAVDELVTGRVDAIVASANFVALEALRRTTTIPIIVRGAYNPVALGLVSSTVRPGGNVTGILALAGPEIWAKRLALLKQAAPSVSRVADLWIGDFQFMDVDFRAIQDAARKLGIDLVKWEVDETLPIERTFEAFKRDGINGLLAVARDIKRFVELARVHRLPTVYGLKSAVLAGGLMAYGAASNARSSADFVNKVLRGTKAGDIPMDSPREFELYLNLKAARDLGLTFSHSLLTEATHIVR